jgi:leader peptidase (prepilin peptidase)/N-methyltransferase
LPVVILLSAVVGSVVGIALIAFGGRSRQAAIPFGPYLAAAGFIAVLWGERIVQLYHAWFFR